MSTISAVKYTDEDGASRFSVQGWFRWNVLWNNDHTRLRTFGSWAVVIMLIILEKVFNDTRSILAPRLVDRG